MDGSGGVLTIGMPVFNGEAFVSDAINSLLNQSFKDFTLIISDNCSTDQTGQICMEYAKIDSRVRYVRHGYNMGAAQNFGFLLDSASSTYFMWSAADDLWELDYLQEAIKLLADADAGFCFPTFRISSIKHESEKKYDKKLFKFIEATQKRVRVLDFLRLHHYSHKCNLVYSLFRTELLQAAYRIQDISNDGALAAVILGITRGVILEGFRFNKRYQDDWPSRSTAFKRILFSRHIESFEPSKQAGKTKLFDLFPEYSKEIDYIFNKYNQHFHGKDYAICDSL